MSLLYLTQSSSNDLDLSSDGVTDTHEMNFLNNEGKDFQIVRSLVDNFGQPLISFQISNDGVNWADWEIVGFIFKDLNYVFEFIKTKHTFFRLSWLSNSSLGTFTANFSVV